MQTALWLSPSPVVVIGDVMRNLDRGAGPVRVMRVW
jgi:hypothetical protein